MLLRWTWTCFLTLLISFHVHPTLSFLHNTSPAAFRTSQLHIGKFFDSLLAPQPDDAPEPSGAPSPTPPKPVVDLSATNVKVGPLKFFLQIYLVAEQNKPVQGAWVLNKNEENERLEMYYKDGTGMFSVDIQENYIRIFRHGQRPSLEYVLQESLMLHGVLDEIYNIAFENNDIDQAKRLLQLLDENVIAKARQGLPAKKAV